MATCVWQLLGSWAAPAVAQVNVSGPAVTVSANATDDTGVVGVQFLLDGIPLGSEDLTAPYTITWDTTQVPNGVHSLGARARDAAGNVGTSPSVSVDVANVDSTPPSVTITSPPAGAIVSGTWTVSATAVDDIGVVGVQFLIDGVPLGAEDLAEPYLIPWDTTSTLAGGHVLTAVARDGAGNTSVSAPVSVTVDPQIGLPPPPPPDPDPTEPPPTDPVEPAPPDPSPDPGTSEPDPAPSSISPGDVRWQLTLVRDATNMTDIHLTSDLNGIEDLELYIDDVFQTAVASASLDYTWDAHQLMGYHEVRVVVPGLAAPVAVASVFDSPSTAGNSTATLELSPFGLIGATLVHAEVAVPGVEKVELYIDGALYHSESGNTIDYGWNTRDLGGEHQVLVAAYNSTGVVSSLSVAYRPN